MNEKKRRKLRKLTLKYTDLIDVTKYRLVLKRRDGFIMYSTNLGEAVLIAIINGGRCTIEIPSWPGDEWVLNIEEIE